MLTALDALALGRPVRVGSSFGGRVALDVARMAPDRFAGVVMIGSSPSGVVPTLNPRDQHLSDPADEAESIGDWSVRAELEVDIRAVGPTRRRDEVDPASLAQVVDRFARAHGTFTPVSDAERQDRRRASSILPLSVERGAAQRAK